MRDVVGLDRGGGGRAGEKVQSPEDRQGGEEDHAVLWCHFLEMAVGAGFRGSLTHFGL